jgi:excisionase family DNA binding protein
MEQVATTVDDAAAALGIGRTKLYELISRGDLKAFKIGRRTLVTTKSIRDLIVT